MIEEGTRIPAHFEFLGWMEARADLAEDMPDGAWWAMLEEGAEEFMEDYDDIPEMPRWGGQGFSDANEAVHYFLRHRDENPCT